MATHRYRIHIQPMSHDSQTASHFEQFAFEMTLQTDLHGCVAAAHAQGFVEEDHAAAYGVALALLTEVLGRRASEPLFAALREQLRLLVERLPDANLGFLSEVLFPEKLEKPIEAATTDDSAKGNRSFNEKT